MPLMVNNSGGGYTTSKSDHARFGGFVLFTRVLFLFDKRTSSMCFQKRLTEAHSRVLIFSLRCVVFFNKTGFKLSRVWRHLNAHVGMIWIAKLTPSPFVITILYALLVLFLHRVCVSAARRSLFPLLLYWFLLCSMCNEPILITCYACTHLNFEQNKCKFKCTYVCQLCWGVFIFGMLVNAHRCV